MAPTARPLTSADVPDLAALWNATRAAPVGERDLRRCLLDDPNRMPERLQVAVDGGRLVAFAGVVARDRVPGADGRGSPEGLATAHWAGLCLADEAEESVLHSLADGLEEGLLAGGKERLLTGLYSGSYLAPGVDLADARLIGCLEARGYLPLQTIDDMDLDLTTWQPTPAQREAVARAADAGVRIIDWDPAFLPSTAAFAAELGLPGWFPLGWERGYGRPRDTRLLAVRDGAVVGFADWWPGAAQASFGPIGVLPSERGHGIGSALLCACCSRAQASGARRIWASWTNTPFYLPAGWRVCRQYAVLERRLG